MTTAFGNLTFALHATASVRSQTTFSPKFGKKFTNNEQENIDLSTAEDEIPSIVALNRKSPTVKLN